MKLNNSTHKQKKQYGFTIIELMIATSVFAVVILIATTTIIYVSKTYIKGQVEAQTQLTAQTILATISNDIKFNQGSSVNVPAGQTGNGINGPFYFCIGNHAYVYQLDTDLSPNYGGNNPMYAAHDLVVFDDGGSCPATTPSFGPTGIMVIGDPHPFLYGSSTRELLSANQRLGQLTLKQISVSTNAYTYQLNLTVAYGEDDLLNDNSLSAAQASTDSNPRQRPPGVVNASPSEAYGYKCVDQQFGGNFCAVSPLTTVITARIN